MMSPLIRGARRCREADRLRALLLVAPLLHASGCELAGTISEPWSDVAPAEEGGPDAGATSSGDLLRPEDLRFVGYVRFSPDSGDDLWYEAVVGELVGDSRSVVYADGSSEDRPMDALRDGGISPGTAVEARVRGTDTVITGSVLRRIEHGVLIQPATGAPVWFSLGNVRIRG
jgi:hypothetical protein